MNKQGFLNEVENLLEITPGSLTGQEMLKDFKQWDSLQVLGFIALVEEKFSVVVDGPAVARAQTVDDLALLVKDHLQADL